MLPIAGQTAGPIELIFFVNTHGWSGGGGHRLKNLILKKKLNFFHGQRRALSVLNNYSVSVVI